MKKLLTLLLCIPSICLPAETNLPAIPQHLQKLSSQSIPKNARSIPTGPKGENLMEMQSGVLRGINLIGGRYEQNGTVMAEIKKTDSDITTDFYLPDIRLKQEEIIKKEGREIESLKNLQIRLRRPGKSGFHDPKIIAETIRKKELSKPQGFLEPSGYLSNPENKESCRSQGFLEPSGYLPNPENKESCKSQGFLEPSGYLSKPEDDEKTCIVKHYGSELVRYWIDPQGNLVFMGPLENIFLYKEIGLRRLKPNPTAHTFQLNDHGITIIVPFEKEK